MLLGGVTIQLKHAVFETTDKGTTIKPLCKEAVEFISINGKPMKDMKAVLLKPNDRIVFGTSSVFLFKHNLNEKDASMADTADH